MHEIPLDGCRSRRTGQAARTLHSFAEKTLRVACIVAEIPGCTKWLQFLNNFVATFTLRCTQWQRR
jgi:hypothetical protein